MRNINIYINNMDIEKMKRKTLIITNTIDKTVDYIMEQYGEVGEFYRFNVDQFPDYRINVSMNGLEIECSKWKISSQGIYSIYYRKPRLPDLNNYEKPYHIMIARDIVSLVNGLIDSFEGKVLSKPSVLRRTENKTFQFLYALEHGIRLPKSYIGNNEINIECLSGKRIIKPLTTAKIKVSSGVELYRTNYCDDISENISLTPIYVQEYIEKSYEVRLTYINGYFFAVRIDSVDKLDWRNDYEGHTYTVITVPPQIVSLCEQMLSDFGLNFGTFDFIVNKDAEWVFLELNPNGQWLWIEHSMGIPISKHIVQYLTE